MLIKIILYYTICFVLPARFAPGFTTRLIVAAACKKIKLPLTQIEIQVPVQYLGRTNGCSKKAVQTHPFVFFQYNIQNAARTCRVVFGRWIGDQFYFFNIISWYLVEGENGWSAIYENLRRTIP